MTLTPLQKLIVILPLQKPQNGRLVGIKEENDRTKTYFIEPLTSNFGPYKNGMKLIRISSRDIDKNEVIIQKH